MKIIKNIKFFDKGNYYLKLNRPLETSEDMELFNEELKESKERNKK